MEIYPEYAPALLGIQGFSHLWVFYWFHGNDTPEQRVPNPSGPPRPRPGQSPDRRLRLPGPGAPQSHRLHRLRIIKVEGNVVEVADLDARDGTPILDLKPYIPGGDAIPEAVTPGWLKRSKPPPISIQPCRYLEPLTRNPM